MNKRGFTLFELLIYLGLSTIFVPVLFSYLFDFIQTEIKLEKIISNTHESFINRIK